MNRSKKIYYIHFDSVDSTNTWAKKNASTLDPDLLTCITAIEQTSGRGRFSRVWVSPKGLNIYASLYLTLPEEDPSLLHLIQLLALSCVRTLQGQGFHPRIKWPNDVLIEKKKIAGILCETVKLEGRLGVILGIGINVNMTKELLETIDQPATSLAQLSGKTWELEQILNPLVKEFLDNLDLLREKGFEPFRGEYEGLSEVR